MSATRLERLARQRGLAFPVNAENLGLLSVAGTDPAVIRDLGNIVRDDVKSRKKARLLRVFLRWPARVNWFNKRNIAKPRRFSKN